MMKTYRIPKYFMAAAALCTGAALLPSCELEPYEIPAEELYLRSFIKKFGLINPEQDWNMADPTSVKIISDGSIAEINVLVNVAGNYYRVGHYKDVTGSVEIGVDIPDGCTDLRVDIDGYTFYTEPGGTVDYNAAARRNAPSRPVEYPTTAYQNLRWVLVAEDLGATDDFDFNDIIVSIEELAVNYTFNLGNTDWQVVGGDENVDISEDISRSSSRAVANPAPAGKKMLTVRALAAGGWLNLWLHYRSTDNTDYVLANGNMYTHTAGEAAAEKAARQLEWHRWFGVANNKTIINTGSSVDGLNISARTGIKSVVYADASFSLNKYSYVDYDNTVNPGKGDSYDNSFIWDPTKYGEYNIQGFYITVEGPTIETASRALVAPEKGAAPQMFLIPDVGDTSVDGGSTYWKWPSERTDITTVYANFKNWVQTPNAYTTWYQTISPGASWYTVERQTD